MSRERYQSTLELMAYDDGYKQGRVDGIDALVEELNNIFIYRHDMVEIQQIAEKLKSRIME